MGTWIQRTSMPTPRHDLQAIAVNGSIYAISGANDLTVDAVEIYDVATDSWTRGPSIPTRRGWLGAARIGRKIYVAGGKTYRPPEARKPFARQSGDAGPGRPDLVGAGAHARWSARWPRRDCLPEQDLGHRRQYHALR